ncbi:carcinoembryonic antigen-related cell adhesion molecule 5-like [Mytilus californianus]|uniref:carcinoembryonic antigen-related cell adhesion molecule 5-like n=1 Tax=Mytilus californianus TaxID=6549 RepID=UPI00224683F4|nr:carcinoembryonic antigen-related cell adhesion molecule 5-like [Mytilus californianus]
MHTFILKVQLLLILHTLGIKCLNTFKENTTLFVDNGDTFVFNCTCFSGNESAWKGPDGNDTVLTAYSTGRKINPYLNIPNIFIYGNYTIGKCHLEIANYSTVNDGIYECSYLLSGNLHIQRYNVFSKRPPKNLKIMEASENNAIYGKEGVRIELKCTVKTGIPASTLFLSKEGLTVSYGRSDILLYQFTPTRLDHMQNITCYALSELLTAPLSQTIYLDIQYGPSLKIIQQTNESNIEGESVKLCCHSNSNPNVHYIGWAMNSHELNSWRQRGRMKVDGTRKVFCLRLSPLYRNHTGNHTCIAENSIAKSNSSIAINVLYPPDVKVSYKISDERITLHCIPDGKPDSYTYYDWKHKSEFNEDIRTIHGTPEGQLIIKKSHSRKANEDDGIYVCTVFNGVPDLQGNFHQEGQTFIESIGKNYKPIEMYILLS